MPTATQQALIDAVRRALEADARVVSLWLSGSFGKGEADAFSDVDFLAVVPDGAGFEIVDDYTNDLSAIADVVHARALYGRIVTAVTPELGRFDLFFTTEGELAAVDPAGLTPLFERGSVRPAGGPAPAPPSRLEANVAEFLRVLALAPVVVGRAEYLVGVDGAMLLRRMVVDTMLEENGVTPAMRGGALKLQRFLTDAQRAELEALPPLAPTRDSVIASHGALARLFLPRARALATVRGLAWPERFEDAVREGLRRELALEI